MVAVIAVLIVVIQWGAHKIGGLNMAGSWGTRGEGGKNLVRNPKKFRQHFEEIDFSKLEIRKAVKVKGGKKSF